MSGEQAIKHDGYLDSEHTTHQGTKVSLTQNLIFPNMILIEGGYGDMESSCVSLDAKQALSLLAWLEQERTTLEQLATHKKR
jgi:hypothetical protein